MAKPAIIFDLDQTLLDTSALEEARARKDWDYVLGHLDEVQPFTLEHEEPSPLPHELPGLLHAKGYQVAVVTSSRSKYAKKVLKKFEVHYDALVAYEDTDEHKPDPAPLKKALERLGVDASNAYYVGDAADDFAASSNAGIRSIGAGWNPAVEGLWRTAPDTLLYHPGLLQRPSLLPRLGYVAEVLAAGLEPFLHPGSFLRCGSPTRLALGRYFPAKDARHVTHALTNLVLTLKNDDEPSELFGRAVAHCVAHMDAQPTFATCVPPKPSQKKRIRFAETLRHMRTHVPHLDVRPDGMYATKEVEDYKRTSRDDRAALVEGAFASEYTWGQEDVLLLDDVLTSGATTDECTRVLAASQAANVHIVCLSVDQDVMNTHVCPDCGRVCRVQYRGRDGCPFWACPGFYKDGCRYTADYP